MYYLQSTSVKFLEFLRLVGYLYHSTVKGAAFLPARRYASAVFATATCPDVRLSVTRRHCA